jgi:hypothetical protein
MRQDDDDDENAGERAVAAYFHGKRAARKEAGKGKPKTAGDFLHHRANTDWWNDALGRKN